MASSGRLTFPYLNQIEYTTERIIMISALGGSILYLGAFLWFVKKWDGMMGDGEDVEDGDDLL